MLNKLKLNKIKQTKHRIAIKRHITAAIVILLPTLSIANENNNIPAIDCIIEPNVIVDLSSSVKGVLDTLTVDKSDEVKKGQVIATLKSDIEQVNVKSSRQRLQLSTAEYKRAAELYREKAITKSEKERSDTDRKLAELELKYATTSLNLRRIKSPIDGIVVKRFANPGEFVEAKPILQLAQLNPLRIEVVSPVDNYEKIVKGMKAKIFPEFGDYKNLVAKVVMVDKVIDAASGTFSVRLELDNKDHAIPGGLKCSAEFMPLQLATSKSTKPKNNLSGNVENTLTKKSAKTLSESLRMKVATADVPPIASLSGGDKSTDSMLCKSIGPYKKQTTLTGLLSQLKVDIKEAKLRVEPGYKLTYQVVTRLFDSEEEAIRVEQEMRQAGFNDIAFLAITNSRQLTLGVYSSDETAIERRNVARLKGFDAKVIVRAKDKTVYFADIAYSSASANAIAKHIKNKDQHACVELTKVSLLE